MIDQLSPSPNGDNGTGRNLGGRFAKGNPGGPGNPCAKRVGELRSLMLAAVSDEDLVAIVKSMVQKAKHGDMLAAREVLDRCLGKARQEIAISTDDEQMGTTEERLERLNDKMKRLLPESERRAFEAALEPIVNPETIPAQTDRQTEL